MALLDAYERKARLTPGLLAFAPVAFAIATLGFKKFPAIAIAVGVLSAAGGAYALAILVAHLGGECRRAFGISGEARQRRDSCECAKLRRIQFKGMLGARRLKHLQA